MIISAILLIRNRALSRRRIIAILQAVLLILKNSWVTFPLVTLEHTDTLKSKTTLQTE